jgi:hypothetical protein
VEAQASHGVFQRRLSHGRPSFDKGDFYDEGYTVL